MAPEMFRGLCLCCRIVFSVSFEDNSLVIDKMRTCCLACHLAELNVYNWLAQFCDNAMWYSPFGTRSARLHVDFGCSSQRFRKGSRQQQGRQALPSQRQPRSTAIRTLLAVLVFRYWIFDCNQMLYIVAYYWAAACFWDDHGVKYLALWISQFWEMLGLQRAS
jgi:hypothetical protein